MGAVSNAFKFSCVLGCNRWPMGEMGCTTLLSNSSGG